MEQNSVIRCENSLQNITCSTAGSSTQTLTRSLQIMIIFNEEGLSDLKPPCVAMTHIDHNALLYKLFVIGDCFHVIERPSLRNFASETPHTQSKTIFFDSHDVSKATSSSHLSEVRRSHNALT